MIRIEITAAAYETSPPWRSAASWPHRSPQGDYYLWLTRAAAVIRLKAARSPTRAIAPPFCASPSRRWPRRSLNPPGKPLSHRLKLAIASAG